VIVFIVIPIGTIIADFGALAKKRTDQDYCHPESGKYELKIPLGINETTLEVFWYSSTFWSPGGFSAKV
jgi:hypothetical protein